MFIGIEFTMFKEIEFTIFIGIEFTIENLDMTFSDLQNKWPVTQINELLGDLKYIVSIVFFLLLNVSNFTICSKSAKVYELLRCVLFLVGEMVMCQLGCYGNPGERPLYMYGFQFCFAASIAIWIAQIVKLGNKSEEDCVSKVNCLIANGRSKKD